jgi:VWFA-related protein
VRVLRYNSFMQRGVAAFFLAGLLLAPRGATGVRTEPPDDVPRDAFDDSITVALETIIVRVVDNAGRPILGLTPEDFRVVVRGREVPVLSVDWTSSEETARPRSDVLPMGAETELAPVPAGKLVVFFVQADLNPTRISGQMRMRPYTRELLASLHPSDAVAVVSYDSHLKLWLDFTTDREAVHEAVDRAMIYTPQREVTPAGPPSLAERFDFAEARRVASPERALEVTARALADLPGEKTMIYLGWGLGRFGSGGVTMTPDYDPAVEALSAAHVSVFVLDVTSADYHSLEVGLQDVAEATGGTYARTFRLPGPATDKIAGAISGWYVLAFDRSVLEDAQLGRVKIELRDRRGEVLARPVSLR